ncbi:MAG: hypothetical protein WCQ95_10830 [Bacteroidota bacterium]
MKQIQLQHHTLHTIILIILMFTSFVARAQDCESSVTIVLKNIDGGIYQGQKVTLTPKAGGVAVVATSNAKGEADFTLPCNIIYSITVTNFAGSKEVQSPEFEGGRSIRTLAYEPDMREKEKLFAMTTAEQAEVDKTALTLPDTLFMKSTIMAPPKLSEYFSAVCIYLKNIDGMPLAGEAFLIIGQKRNKTIKCTTGPDGKLFVYLLKGDTYTLNFKYNKGYSSIQTAYSAGSSKMELTFTYLGTKEIERRKKLEAERIAAEDKRRKEEEATFIAKCKKLGITPEEGRKRDIDSYLDALQSYADTVISAVLDRNNWQDKLIVCDLTGSMSPYYAQLTVWYQLHYKKEKNLQFVFFNDGDNKADSDKKIGETGGIYYSPSKGVDSLSRFIARVSSRGSGGDCAENNIEALLKGTKMATPFKELVMIVDNNSPIKDISLLTKFKVPVHIILCGVIDWVLADYLLVAWKTKGSVHTIEQDITNIASMMEGQDVVINGITYRIMGGEFVRITKM